MGVRQTGGSFDAIGFLAYISSHWTLYLYHLQIEPGQLPSSHRRLYAKADFMVMVYGVSSGWWEGVWGRFEPWGWWSSSRAFSCVSFLDLPKSAWGLLWLLWCLPTAPNAAWLGLIKDSKFPPGVSVIVIGVCGRFSTRPQHWWI